MNLVFKNGINLAGIRIILMLFPLIIIPLLISRLGVEGYGQVAYYLALASYYITFVNFGFDETATKHVANLSRGSEELLPKYVGDVFFIKIVSAVSVFLVILSLNFVELASDVLTVFMLVGLVESLNSLWFWHGIQKLAPFTIFTFLSKVIYFLLVYFFVVEIEDLYLVAVFLALSVVLCYLGLILLIRRKGLLKFEFSFERSLKLWKEALPLGLSNFIPVFKDKMGVIVVGAIGEMAAAGALDILMKILNVCFIPINILNGAFFPKLSQRYDDKTFRTLMGLTLGYSILIMLLATIFLMFFDFLLPKMYLSEINAIFALVVSVVFYAVSVTLAKNYYIVKGYYIVVVYTLLISTVVYLICIYFLYSYNAVTIFNVCLCSTVCFALEALLRGGVFSYMQKEKSYDRG